MQQHAITLLGTGLIGDFYAMTLHGQRGRDRVRVVYSRSEARDQGVRRALVDPRDHDRHGGGDPPSRDRRRDRRAAEPPARGGRARPSQRPARRSCAPSRWAAPPRRRSGCSRRSSGPGVFGGYLEDLCYTPKTLKAVASVRAGRARRRHLGPLARDAPRAAQRLVLGRPAHRRRRDHRPRLPLHRDRPQLRRQGEPAGRGDVHDRHAGPPDRRRGQRDRADPVRVGGDRPVRGQLDVPRRHGPARRGRRHRTARSGSTTSCAPATRCSPRAAAAGYVAEKAETAAGWLFPVGDEVSELGYVDMFSDMFNAIDGGGDAARDALRRLRRQRGHGRVLPVGEEPGLGAGRAVRVARRRDAADREEPRDVRRPGRDQARAPARTAARS